MEEGKIDIVTGYFTIGALAYMSNAINHKVSEFRLVLGDIVNVYSKNQQTAVILINKIISNEK